MRTITYTEAPNGARYLASEGKQMDIIEPIRKEEFEEKFPESSTYGISWTETFLENGVILLNSKWNGEHYFSNDKEYAPVYNEVEEDDTEIIGYYEF